MGIQVLGFAVFFSLWWWAAAIGFTAWLAGEKGRNPVEWGIAAVFFNPVALLALIGAPRKEKR